MSSQLLQVGSEVLVTVAGQTVKARINKISFNLPVETIYLEVLEDCGDFRKGRPIMAIGWKDIQPA